ncbi:hypothetical protein EIN_054860 [Entamoeba invadens IP1]|uniref:hypothetical protein n=1 Tax=Entamoeba invadens IP1 TaxID=370355 RepID=UPI0002C3EF15|nr:hypothetical protein EIN_054860 [Entamoeba invadens IP1]ELP93191.1 hypothetical protein EIN_054860 [Entamoeba invadens IP1]|eukprot:XP_004259962.1 hypothetical protein EIN_054860 [Entamoeba invadens IP1]
MDPTTKIVQDDTTPRSIITVKAVQKENSKSSELGRPTNFQVQVEKAEIIENDEEKSTNDTEKAKMVDAEITPETNSDDQSFSSKNSKTDKNSLENAEHSDTEKKGEKDDNKDDTKDDTLISETLQKNEKKRKLLITVEPATPEKKSSHDKVHTPSTKKDEKISFKVLSKTDDDIDTKVSDHQPRCKFVSRASMVNLVTGCSEEKQLDLVDVVLIGRNDVTNFDEVVSGKLILTNYKLFFKHPCVLLNISIPLTQIANSKKVNSNEKVHKRIFTIETKDNRKFYFSFKDQQKTRRQFNDALKALAFATALDKFFIFQSKFPPARKEFYTFLEEFKRQGVSEMWRVCDINTKYTTVPTYPAYIYVPKDSTNAMIMDAIKHRSKGRFPALTWFNKTNGSALVRCAQPLPGIVAPLTGKNTTGDVEFLRSVYEATGEQGIHVLDSRPKLNAVTNKAAGGGYEDVGSYPFLTLEFENIDNIHVVRESLTNLAVSVFEYEENITDKVFLKQQCVKQWFFLQDTIFTSVKKACKYLNEGSSVLVHCSDGWDRTSQCCALVQLLEDQYFRTLEGFIVLVEKDWKSFGHRFATRTGFGQVCPYGQYAPIFFQFLDCVHILIAQFPNLFEFNEQFLIELNDATYCSDYGTFMYDCERERVKNNIEKITPCFWEYVMSASCRFINPAYDKTSSGMIGLTDQQPTMVVWEKYFTRHKLKERKH